MNKKNALISTGITIAFVAFFAFFGQHGSPQEKWLGLAVVIFFAISIPTAFALCLYEDLQQISEREK